MNGAEYWWNNDSENDVLSDKMSYCYFVHGQSHMKGPGTEPGLS